MRRFFISGGIVTVNIKAEVRGAKETQKELERIAKDLHGDKMVDGMRAATLTVESAAKRNLVGYQSPEVGGVDTGRLRASITPEVRTQGKEVFGVVGSNVVYAPFVEFGTKRHWPPLSALEVWASRHGTTAYIVARAIARRGPRGKHYLQKAFESSRQEIMNLIGKAVSGIVR